MGLKSAIDYYLWKTLRKFEKTREKCYNSHIMKGWRENFADESARGERIRWDRRALKTLREIKTWQLFILLLIFVLLAAIFLRLNNLNMLDRANALKKAVAADTPVNMADIQAKTADLQNYVAHHMNTMVAPIALQNVYNQAAQKAIDANKPPDVDGDKYQQATSDCMPQLQNYGYRAWASCVANEVGTADTSNLAANVPAPDPDAYYVNFASVRWSLDPAGVSLLICLILLVAMIFRFIFMIILRITLRFKYRAA